MIAAFINFSHALVYSAGVDIAVVSFLALGLALGVFAFYFAVENFLLDRFLRFVVTPFAGTLKHDIQFS